MNTYAILVDDGYGFKVGMIPRAYVTAKSPQQARKLFLKQHDGAYYAKAKSIKATKVE